MIFNWYLHRVIIRCPQCHKTYTLPPEVEGEPSFDEAHGHGWQVACYACNYEWWQPAHESSESIEEHITPSMADEEVAPTTSQKATHEGYHDFTNLSGLVMGTPTQPHQPAHSAPMKPQPQVNIPGGAYAPRMHGPRTPLGSMGGGNATDKKSSPKVKGIITFIILLTLALAVGLIVLFRGTTSSRDLLNFFTQTKAPHPEEKPLVIRDVKYDARVVGERKTILVVGEVVNPHKKTADLNPLKIAVWGPCPQEQTAQNEGEKSGSCLIATWQHTWDYTTISPQERKLFQTVGSIPADQAIERVDVTLP